MSLPTSPYFDLGTIFPERSYSKWVWGQYGWKLSISPPPCPYPTPSSYISPWPFSHTTQLKEVKNPEVWGRGGRGRHEGLQYAHYCNNAKVCFIITVTLFYCSCFIWLFYNYTNFLKMKGKHGECPPSDVQLPLATASTFNDHRTGNGPCAEETLKDEEIQK